MAIVLGFASVIVAVIILRLNYSNTFDELVGGLMNVLLAEDGQHYQQTVINNGRALVIDIDGFTTDWLAVNPGVEID